MRGITLGKYVFIQPSVIGLNERKQICAPKRLIAHEYAHVLQYRRLDTIKFLLTYFRAFWRGLKRFDKWGFNARLEAYPEIPHEIEARSFEGAYLKWLKKNKGKS